MKAIILAAGMGKRLKPITDKIPKPLVKINGKPLIKYTLENLKLCGINDISIVSGYKYEKMNFSGIKKYKNTLYNRTNMVYSLFCAEKELDNDIIICYGDIIFKKEILKTLIASKDNFSVVVDKNWKKIWKKRMENPLDDAETMKINNKGYIIELGLRPKNFSEIEGQYVGLIKISKKIINRIKNFYHKIKKMKIHYNKRNYKNMFMTDFIQLVINELMPVKAVLIRGGWFEVDSVRDLEIINKNFKNIIN